MTNIPMERMLLSILFGQWLALAKNRNSESTEALIEDIEKAIEALETDNGS